MISRLTSLDGVLILEPAFFSDSLGYFCETYNQTTLKSLAICAQFVLNTE